MTPSPVEAVTVSGAESARYQTRRLARYAAAAVLVRLSDEGARVALLLLALERLGDVGLGGLLTAVLLVPHVIGAPVVGVLTDRSPRPGRLVATAAAGFGLSLVAAGAVLGSVPLGVALVVLLLGGCCGPALTGALSSRLPAMLPPDRLPRGFGLDSLTYNVAGVAGPAAAAVLAATVGARAATVALGCGAVLGAGLILALPGGRAPEDAPGEPGSVAARSAARVLTAGARAILRTPPLAAVTGATTFAQFGAGAVPVVVAVAATRAGRPEATGWLLAVTAAGAFVGSLLWTWRPARTAVAPRVVMVALAASGAPLVLAAGHPTVAVVAVALAVTGVATGPLVGAMFVARDAHAPDGMRGQVFTLAAGLKLTAAAGGSALAGVVAWATTGLQLVVAGGVPVVAALLGAALLRRSAAA